MVTQARATTDWDPSPPAPDALEAVRRFVNTLDCYRGRDDLTDVPSAREALARARAHLSSGPVPVGPADLPGLRAGRAGLRAALGCTALWDPKGSGRPADPDRGSRRVVLRAGTGGVGVDAAGTAAEAMVGRLLLTLLLAQHDGTSSRLKTCANPGCQWVFWDSSRPGSARWCSMRVCGGQAKARRYRQRHSMAADG